MTGSSALWLRVDRPGGATGFFDNMSDRPVRVSEWREYEIEGPVADDATNVAFGDPDGKSLYITACDVVYRVRMKTVGVMPGPKQQ